MNEQDLDGPRRRARRRSSAMMALVVAPIVLLVATVKILERHNYPAGDIRNEPLFWIVVGVAVLILVGGLVVGSIGVLTRDGKRDRSDA